MSGVTNQKARKHDARVPFQRSIKIIQPHNYRFFDWTNSIKCSNFLLWHYSRFLKKLRELEHFWFLFCPFCSLSRVSSYVSCDNNYCSKQMWRKKKGLVQVKIDFLEFCTPTFKCALLTEVLISRLEKLDLIWKSEKFTDTFLSASKICPVFVWLVWLVCLWLVVIRFVLFFWNFRRLVLHSFLSE